MDVHCLFDSEGRWVAFRVGDNIFDPNKKWIGWLPWETFDIVDLDGNYLGTIVDGNRLYKFAYREKRSCHKVPIDPDLPLYELKSPGPVGISRPPLGSMDVAWTQ